MKRLSLRVNVISGWLMAALDTGGEVEKEQLDLIQ